MFNLYKIQLKQKCEELYMENINLKKEIKKYEERYGAPAREPVILQKPSEEHPDREDTSN